MSKAKNHTTNCLTRFATNPFDPETINTPTKWHFAKITRGTTIKEERLVHGKCFAQIGKEGNEPALLVWDEGTPYIDEKTTRYSLAWLDASIRVNSKDHNIITLLQEDNSKLYLYLETRGHVNAGLETFYTIRDWGRQHACEKENAKRKREDEASPIAQKNPRKVLEGFRTTNSISTYGARQSQTPLPTAKATSFYSDRSLQSTPIHPYSSPLPSRLSTPSIASNLAQFSRSTVSQAPFRVSQYGKENIRQTNVAREGFKNGGQTCYINATLQLLFNITDFRQRLTLLHKRLRTESRLTELVGIVYDNGKFQDTLTWILGSVFQRKVSDKVVDAGDLKKCMSKIASQFGQNNQEDAHELLYLMLEQIEMDLAPIGKLLRPESKYGVTDPLNALFCGEIKDVMTCTTCKHERVRESVLKGISLDLPESDKLANSRVVNLEALMHWNFLPKTLEYKCEEEGCNGTHVAVEQFISKIPKMLLIHCKRYEQTLDGRMIKRTEPIVSREHMDIARWCSPDVADSEDTMQLFFEETTQSNISDTQKPSAVSKNAKPTAFIDLDSDDEVDTVVHDVQTSLFSRPPKSLELTEEEQIAAAIAASLQENKPTDEQLEQALKESLFEDHLEKAIRESMSTAPSSQLDLPSSQVEPVSGFDVPSDLAVEERPPKKYSMDAVILHHGSDYHHGHYVTDARFVKNGKTVWKCFNDDLTTTVGEKWVQVCGDSVRRATYILAYTRQR
jgi:ubiquitin C-terminal hydrolase